MKKILIICLLCLTLTGCSTVANDEKESTSTITVVPYSVITDTIASDTAGRRITVTNNNTGDDKISTIKTEYLFQNNKVAIVTQYITYLSIDDTTNNYNEALTNSAYSDVTIDNTTLVYTDLMSKYLGYNFYDLYTEFNVNNNIIVAEK